MINPDIARLRLSNQCIARTTFSSAKDVVRWLGAVQAQDYLGSLWALGLRMRHAGEENVEQAIANRAIVRTWPLRGTLHCVAAEDVHWMLRLSAPRTIGRAAGRYRQLELDDATFAKSNLALRRALRGGKQLTRPELATALNRAGIQTEGQRLIHILGRSALDGLICYAARRTRQFRFALLDEWVPPSKTMARDEALAELARRYFTSHGPATLRDYAWWSGLTMADASVGLEMAKPHLLKHVLDDQTYWCSSSVLKAKERRLTAHLLPSYDEYTVAYKDRSAALNPSYAKRADSGNGIFSPTIVINGQVVGTWKRRGNKESVAVTPSFFTSIQKNESHALKIAVSRYGAFLELPAVLA